MAATHRVARGVGPDDDECLPGARRGVPTAAMQRRAALEFITRELRSLEVEATLKGALEDQVEELTAEVRRAHEREAMYLRRIRMLEAELQRARGEPPRRSDGAGCDSADRSAPDANADPPPPRTATSLKAVARLLPDLPAPELTPADADETTDEIDEIEREIQAQRAMSVPRAPSEPTRAPIFMALPASANAARPGGHPG